MKRPTPRLTFTPEDIIDREMLMEEVETLASRVRDKPGLPSRTMEQKLQDCLVGLVPERYLLQQEGFTKAGKYQDVIGEGFEERWLNGVIEVKTVRQGWLSTVENARAFSGGGQYDYMLFFRCNRATMEYTPVMVMDKRGKIVKQW